MAMDYDPNDLRYNIDAPATKPAAVMSPPVIDPEDPPPILPERVVPPPVGGAAAGGMSPDDLRELETAQSRAKKLRRAGGLAMFNGITFAIFSGLCFLCGFIELMFRSFDWVSWVMGIGLGLVAQNEFRGRKMLRTFDPRGPKVLGWNQIRLMVLIVLYCLWMLYSRLNGQDSIISDSMISGNEDMMRLGGSIENLEALLIKLIYVTVIVATVIFQGINAIYYFTRQKHMRAYLESTPDWVIEVQKRTGA